MKKLLTVMACAGILSGCSKDVIIKGTLGKEGAGFMSGAFHLTLDTSNCQVIQTGVFLESIDFKNPKDNKRGFEKEEKPVVYKGYSCSPSSIKLENGVVFSWGLTSGWSATMNSWKGYQVNGLYSYLNKADAEAFQKP